MLEAKKVKAAVHTKGFDDALMRARAQAESYARALPAAEGRPPFLVVVDVGHVIELYAEFTRSGATYTPFPDARSHRINLADLRDEAVRERLRLLWSDPMALDPSRASAKVTRLVSDQLAKLARSLEEAGHRPESVAAFLTRCLFSMFAEDVGLLPKDAQGQGAFAGLLRKWCDQPDTLRQMLAVLWTDMDRGGFSPALAATVLRFNGKLFKGAGAADYVLPLTRDQIDDLLAAASSNWREVEPSIFGTLLERALDVNERHALGAHYTPRAYVERLVLPTVVEPLRAEWSDAQAAALLLSIEARGLEGKKREERLSEARATVKAFHHRLCTVRVLDPACGSGNFLYVTLEHLKRLEGEVLDQLHALGESQVRLGFEGETVTPQQLLGIEVNERAAGASQSVMAKVAQMEQVLGRKLSEDERLLAVGLARKGSDGADLVEVEEVKEDGEGGKITRKWREGKPKPPSQADAHAEALDAIKAGAPRLEVNKRLRELGYEPLPAAGPAAAGTKPAAERAQKV
ncbi:MAG: hypothetical protein Fur0014_07470 [Rubrivivax sp.]